MQVGLQVTIAQQRQLCRMTTNGVRLDLKNTHMTQRDMASRFSFYSFPEYDILISTIEFLISTVKIIDINN